MSRRLFLIFVLVSLSGLVKLALTALSRWPRLKRSEQEDSGPPAPTDPPRSPAPGRPFRRSATSLSTPQPKVEALREAAKGKNVVICVLDAARADHFGAYGYPRETTPNFDRLAKESLVFEQHFAPVGQTAPSTASLFTSQHPDTHGMLSNSRDDTLYLALDPKAFTLEKGLQQAGFTTFLMSSNPAASPDLGVGGDFMNQDYRGGMGRRSEGSPVDYLAGLMEALPGRLKQKSDPFFAYVHLLPPHMPYRAPEEMNALFAGGRPPRHWEGQPDFVNVEPLCTRASAPSSWVDWGNLYDANLHWADSFVGKLVETLARSGLLEETLLIVTADHGEALGEHGSILHVDCPYDEVLHIPLLVRFPGASKPVGRVHALTQTVDVTPTILDLQQLPIPRTEVQGKSLAPLLTGEDRQVNEYVFGHGGNDNTFAVVRDAHFTLLLHKDGKQRALYDMDADSWQTRNVIAEQPKRAAELARAFAQFAEAQKYPPLNFIDPGYQPKKRNLPSAKMSEETKRRLKSLGYLR